MLSPTLLAAEKLNVSRGQLRAALTPAIQSGTSTLTPLHGTVHRLLEPYAKAQPFAMVTGAFLAGALLASNKSAATRLAIAVTKSVIPRLVPAVFAALPAPVWPGVLELLLHVVDKKST